MRPCLALYIGGMGSRKQNFYNALVRRYGFEADAERVQDLYLEGRKDEAAAALPGPLIDAVSLCGPPDVVRDRIALFRDAGVGTLIVSPMSWSFEDRLRQLQLVAELGGVTLPPDLEVRPARPGDEAGIAALVAACDESYRAWTPPGWTPPPPGAELDRWRGRIVDGSVVDADRFRAGPAHRGAGLLHPGGRPAHAARAARPAGARSAGSGRQRAHRRPDHRARARVRRVHPPGPLARGDRRRPARPGRGRDARRGLPDRPAVDAARGARPPLLRGRGLAGGRARAVARASSRCRSSPTSKSL